MDIAAARALPDDMPVVVDGVLTLDLGSIDGARGGFVQDLTAGIGLYLTADPPALAPLGTHVRITGVLDTRYAQRVIRVAPDAVEGSARPTCRWLRTSRPVRPASRSKGRASPSRASSPTRRRPSPTVSP